MTAARRILAEVFGFAAFRPGQERVIEALLAGGNALAVMPTGSGKSLCFQVPALVMDGLTVVVSPLVALMRDQVAALIRGTTAPGEAASALHGAGRLMERAVGAMSSMPTSGRAASSIPYYRGEEIGGAAVRAGRNTAGISSRRPGAAACCLYGLAADGVRADIRMRRHRLH